MEWEQKGELALRTDESCLWHRGNETGEFILVWLLMCVGVDTLAAACGEAP